MEQERQDQLIQELINNAIKTRKISRHEKTKTLIGQERDEWIEITAILIDKGFITRSPSDNKMYVITPKGDQYGGDRYIREQQQARILQQQNEEKEKKSTEKLENELTLSRWQKKTFWWFFFIALIGGVLGTISFFKQINEKPVIEKKYIPVDSHGKTYKSEKVN